MNALNNIINEGETWVITDIPHYMEDYTLAGQHVAILCINDTHTVVSNTNGIEVILTQQLLEAIEYGEITIKP